MPSRDEVQVWDDMLVNDQILSNQQRATSDT